MTVSDCRAFSLFGDRDRQSDDITDTERCDAIHELGKFLLCKTEIIFRIA